MHFRQWKRANQTSLSQDDSRADIHAYAKAAIKPLSSIEKKYLSLFLEGKTTEEISTAMHVEPSSVYTMKYRLRKKFPADYHLPF